MIWSKIKVCQAFLYLKDNEYLGHLNFHVKDFIGKLFIDREDDKTCWSFDLWTSKLLFRENWNYSLCWKDPKIGKISDFDFVFEWLKQDFSQSLEDLEIVKNFWEQESTSAKMQEDLSLPKKTNWVYVNLKKCGSGIGFSNIHIYLYVYKEIGE